MNKKDRQMIFEKYGDRCAYCGCGLVKGWHVDEIEPIVRGVKYLNDDNGKRLYKDGKPVEEKYITYPERINIDNQNPSCASCNIQKHRQSLEDFRRQIAAFINSLNQYNSIYRFVKRYGLIQETGIEVKFYFETLTTQPA